jgi:hypothetical protein
LAVRRSRVRQFESSGRFSIAGEPTAASNLAGARLFHVQNRPAAHRYIRWVSAADELPDSSGFPRPDAAELLKRGSVRRHDAASRLEPGPSPTSRERSELDPLHVHLVVGAGRVEIAEDLTSTLSTQRSVGGVNRGIRRVRNVYTNIGHILPSGSVRKVNTDIGQDYR